MLDSSNLHRNEFISITEVSHIDIQSLVIVLVFKEVDLSFPNLDKFKGVDDIIFCIQ